MTDTSSIEKLIADARARGKRCRTGYFAGQAALQTIGDEHDALCAALESVVKERDKALEWKDVFDKQASGLFMECFAQMEKNRVLRKERDALERRIGALRALVEKISRTSASYAPFCDKALYDDEQAAALDKVGGIKEEK